MKVEAFAKLDIYFVDGSADVGKFYLNSTQFATTNYV